MKKIYPPKLRKGDVVRVIAPARSLDIISSDVRKTAKDRFAKMGLKLEFGKNVNETDDFLSSSIKSRIADLHEAFRDPRVNAVTSVIGGYNSNQLLDYINWNLIRKNPKIFCGFSDITALNNAIFTKTGLVNYSGPAFSTFGKQQGGEYTTEYYKKCLFSDESIEVKPSDKWDNRDWWVNQKDEKTFRNPGWKIIQKGETTGTIIGANLCTLNLLQGTQYFPPLENSVLFIEDDYESNALIFDRDLQSLIHQEGFERVKGIVIGRFEIASKVTDSLLDQIIKSKKELKNLPIISGVDFGHTDPKITFPIGGEVEIVANKNQPSIKIIKH